MKVNTTSISLQILFWIAFLAFPFLLSPETGTLSHFLHSTPMQKEIIYYLLLIGFFYLSYYLLIPKLYVRGRYLWLVGTILIAFYITSYLPWLIGGLALLSLSSFFWPKPDSKGAVVRNLKPDMQERVNN